MDTLEGRHTQKSRHRSSSEVQGGLDAWGVLPGFRAGHLAGSTRKPVGVASFTVALCDSPPSGLGMGAKYLSTIKDQKANERYHRKLKPIPQAKNATPPSPRTPAAPKRKAG